MNTLLTLMFRGKNVKRYLNINNIIFAGLVCILLLATYLHAHNAIYTIDFSPVNGTFQNYNVVRRLLDGQIPFRDFNVYLGVGHLYLGSLITLIFGGNYAGSVMAFGFITLIVPVLFMIILGKSILKKGNTVVLSIANIFLIVILTQILTKNAGGGISL